MIVASASGVLTWLALVAACGLAGGSLVVRGPWQARLAVLALAFCPLAIGRQLGDSLSGTNGLVIFGTAVLGITALVVATRPFVGHPRWVLIAAVAVLPFRLPLSLSDASSANLLLPLYLVIAAGVLAVVVRERPRLDAPGPREIGRPDPAVPARPPVAPLPPGERALRVVLALTLAAFALQAAYSSDLDEAARQAAFFLVPFATLFVLIRRTAVDRRLLGVLAAVMVGEAVVFSLVGFVEYATRHVLWNPKVIGSNQFEDVFRVNSVFWDPNIYGRFLAVAMLLVATALLWARRAAGALGAAGVLVVLWGGLLVTFSQSSFTALLAGLAVLAAVRWSVRWTVAAVAGGAAVLIVALVVAGGAVGVDLKGGELNRTTSGRARLVEGGVALFGDRPVWGYGSGAFAVTYREQRRATGREASSASHTEPVTVAAERGVIGLALYLALLAACAGTLTAGILGPARREVGEARGREVDEAGGEAGGSADARGEDGRTVTSRRGIGAAEGEAGGSADARGPGSSGTSASAADDSAADHSVTASWLTVDAAALARVAVLATFAALVVHSLTYDAFLTDPFTWVLLALGAAAAELLVVPRRRRARRPARIGGDAASRGSAATGRAAADPATASPAGEGSGRDPAAGESPAERPPRDEPPAEEPSASEPTPG